VKVLSAVATEAPEGVVVGDTSLDDAAVLRWPSGSVDGPYLVQTVDFVTPVVDDPFTFGAVAAANALSDVYSMGGVPRFCLAIAGFPGDLPLWVLEEILAGGASKVREAGAIIVGGHTVKDAEPKYGLSVTGEVTPDALVTQAAARPGDVLVLTKPLGTGLLIGALREDALDAEVEAALIDSMTRLNATAAAHMVAVGAKASTDVTGFGLLGHAWHVAKASGVTLVLEGAALPALPTARDRAATASLGGAAKRNHDYVKESLELRADDATLRLAVDAQTSGGLLIAVRPDRADELLQRLHDDDVAAARVGEVTAGDPALSLR